MTVLIFFVVLFILILVHEWGHFIVAKKTGMRVDEFGIGFPPRLFGIKKGETEYTFNLLPIGGFVRIFGEDAVTTASARLDADVPEQSDGNTPSSGQRQYDENAEDAEHAKEQGSDISRSFTSKSKWAQTAVLLAGVTMNVIFAWFLFVIVFIIGVPTAVDEATASQDAAFTITHVLPDGPADRAGIPVGAIITGYAPEAGEELTPSAFSAYASTAQGPIVVTYEYDGEMVATEVTPVLGLIPDEPNKPAIGVALSLVETVNSPFHIAVLDATVTTYESLIAILVGTLGLFADIAQLDADLSQVAGPVGIVGLVGDAAQFGFASLLMFTAIISLNLAVINLLPFPALDGGRLVFVAVEAITRRPIDPAWVLRLNTLGFILLILLMLAVTYSDIAKLI